MTRSSTASSFRLFALLALALLALRLVALALSPLSLHGDEAQYWAWSRSLDWGYFSKPPLIAWTIAAATSLFGNEEWAVRLAAPFAHTGAAFALFALGQRLFDAPRAGFWAGLGWLLMPGVQLSCGIMSTDALLLPLWAAALLACARLRDGAGLGWSVALGAAIGLGLLAKYAMLYFLAGAALAALIDAPTRRALLSWRGALALTVAAAFLAPNLAWNAAHKFETLKHTAENAALSGGPTLKPQEALQFLGDQAAVLGPVLFVVFLLILALSVRAPKGLAAAERWLLAFALPPLVVILVESVLSRSNANWAAAAYPALIVLLAGRIGQAKWRPALLAGHALNAAFGLVLTVAALSLPAADALGLTNSIKRARAWDQTAALVFDHAAKAPYDAILVDERMTFYELLYYGRDRAHPPLRMFVLTPGAPQNHAENTAPLREGPESRHVLTVAAPDMTDLLAQRFARVGAPTAIFVPLGPNKQRDLVLRDGFGYAEPSSH